jgi:hypothetical protein
MIDLLLILVYLVETVVEFCDVELFVIGNIISKLTLYDVYAP